MGKFYGKVGFVSLVEDPAHPDVYKDVATERDYYGDELESFHSTRYNNPNGGTNDDIRLQHRISILMDPFALDNYYDIRYVKIGNCKWKVTDINEVYPRLELTIGGRYNG